MAEKTIEQVAAETGLSQDQLKRKYPFSFGQVQPKQGTLGEAVKTIGTFAAESAPGLGEALALKRTSDALDEQDYLGAGIEATAGLFGVAPVVGDALGKGIRSLRPKKTVKAYKLFTKGEDGNLYPLFVDADTAIPQGEFISAVIPESVFTAPNGKKYVPSKGTGDKKGTGDNIKIPDQATRDMLIEKGFLPKGSEAKTVKAVALRGGFHAGDSPAAPHIGPEYKGQKYRPENQVWAEVEMPADVDWQSVADANASVVKSGPRKGQLNVAEAQITDQLPSGGYYRYKTNPNMQGNWLISGEMKVNRVLDADEVKRLNDEAGTPDLPTLEELKAKEVTYDADNPYFHGTKGDYSQVDLVPVNGDMGFHVGTSKQADFRLPYLPENPTALQRKDYLQDAEGARIMKLALRSDLKPLRVPDIGQFKQPDSWLGQLAVDADDEHIIRYLNQEPEDAALLASAPKVEVDGKTFRMQPDVRRTKMPPEVWKDLVVAAYNRKKAIQDVGSFSEDAAVEKYFHKVSWFADVKEVLNKHGYDSLVYRNEYEGAFDMADSYMLTEPDQVKNVFGGMTPGDPDLNKNRGGLMMQEGGAVPMQKQMELFMDDYQVAEVGMDQPKKMAEGGMMKDGGLEQDGGTTDPVSGNDVPPGSSKEEVRDDIPAQLSEGEFVFPADVVRYIGLEKLMMMRQEAKMGLKMMEEMGQMGNSDEATMPDDLPFGVTDLIIVDGSESVDDDDKKEYNTGGVVYGDDPTTGITYQAPQFQAGQTQVGMAASPIEMAPISRPVQQETPVYQPPETLPTPGEFLQSPEGQAPQTITIVNKETGEERMITFIPGVTEIPAGFVRKEDYVPKEVVPETQTTTVETARVREDDPSDSPETPGGATIAFGGNVIPGTTNRVENMFRGSLEVGGLGFNDGRAYAMSTFASGQQNIPEGGFATITNITLPRPEGVYSGTGQLLGNNMRMDADIFNKYMAGNGNLKATERAKIARAGQHIKEMYTDKGVTGMTIDVDQRMLNQIDQIDEARKQLKEDSDTGGGRTSFTITEKDNNGNVTNVANVSKKVAQEIASGVDIEAAAFDYSGFYDDNDSSPSGGGQSFSSGSTESAFGGDMDNYGFDADDDDLYNAGGLAAKKKPKAKKMKRGGLASKKQSTHMLAT